MRRPAPGIASKIVSALACLAVSCGALAWAAPAIAASPSASHAPSPSTSHAPSPSVAPSLSATTTPTGTAAAEATKAPIPSAAQVVASFAPGADQSCGQPLHGWAYIDPALSKPLAPTVEMWYDGFRFGGGATDYWGDGQFDVANMVQQPTGSAAQLVLHPSYDKAGVYTLRSVAKDACGRTVEVDRTYTVPIVLPALDSVSCPGEIADKGVCLVAGGKDSVLSVTGPDSGAGVGWDWTVYGSGDLLDATSIRLSLKFGDVTYIQATRPAPDGKSTIITPIMPLASATVAAPQITDFKDPGRVLTGESVDLSFTPPSGFGPGTPSISIDGVVVAGSTEYSTSFASPGQHTVDYSYAIEGHTTATASASIRVVAPDNWLPAVLGILAVVTLLIALLMGLWIRAEWRNLRRRRARAKRRRARDARYAREAEMPPDEQE